MRRLLTLCCAYWLLCVRVMGADDQPRPWEKRPFEAAAKEIAEAAKSLAVDDGLSELTLLDERQFSIDEQGRITQRVRRVTRVLSQEAVEENSTVRSVWSPWHQERPELTARVITPDGAEHRLQPQDIAEQPANQTANNVLDDRREVKAPLPAVKVGVVIEVQFVIREHKPLFAKGTVRRNYWPSSNTLCATLKIDSPAQQSVSVKVRGGAIEPRRSEQAGRVILDFERRASADAQKSKIADEFEWLTPPDQPVWLEVQFGTGKTWQEIATAYSEIIERKLENAGVKPVADQALAGAVSREEKVQKLLSKVHEFVRYTAVHFGDAALIPNPPLETLRRRYGDCKDQATLLVGLLQAAGIRAHVALLNSGRGPDIHPELPGLGTMNHAIVFVPGDPPIWIDPTVMFLPAGRLPSNDQGRWALAIDGETKELMKTPRDRSTDNVSQIAHELTYSTARQGVARVTTRHAGAPATAVRNFYAETSPKDLRESWERYSLATFQTKSLRKLEHSDPHDLSAPCTLTAECVDSPLLNVSGLSFVVPIRLDNLIDDLPYLLRPPVKDDPDERENETNNEADRENEKASEKAVSTKPKPRRAPVWLHDRFVKEETYRIQPPIGYVPKELPEKKSFDVAGATFSQQFETEESGLIVAKFRFDTGEGIFSPEKLLMFQEALREAASPAQVDNWTISLTFEHKGFRDFSVGQMKEAVKVFDQLSRQFPQEAVRQLQMSDVLARVGLGALAREYAQRAVELEPKLADAHEQLYFALARDQLGRDYGPGFDRKGARAALETLIRLVPANAEHLANLAILLEHSSDGSRYGLDASLKEALDIYERLSKPIKADATDPYFVSRAIVLGHLDQFAVIKSLVAKRPPSLERDAYLIAATAALDGVEAAKQKGRQLAPDLVTRREYFLNAGDLLNRFRKYSEAIELFEAGLGGPKDQQIREIVNSIRLLKRVQKSPLAEDDPAYVVRAVLQALLTGGDEERNVFQWFAGSPKSNRDVKSIRELQRSLAGTRRLYRETEHSTLRLRDVVTLFDAKQRDQTDDLFLLTNDLLHRGTVWFVIREEGGLRLLDTFGSSVPLADQMLRALEQGREADARKIMSWLKPRFPKAPGGFFAKLDPFSDSPFINFTSTAQLDVEALKVAAAAVSVIGPEHEKALAILEKAQETATEPNRIQLDRAISNGLMRRDHFAEGLTVIERLETRYANKSEVMFMKGVCLAESTELEKGWAYLEPLAAKFPKEAQINLQAARLAASLGKYDRAIELARLARHDMNNDIAALVLLARTHLFHDEVPIEAITAAEQAANRDGKSNPESLFILAAVQARTGKPREALETLGQAIDVRRGDPHPNGDDWYVIGLVAEEYGLTDYAQQAYAKVPMPTDARRQDTPHALAQRRLVLLKNAEK